MRFKIDEKLPVELAITLGNHGHEASTVPSQGLGGHPDNDIASTCKKEKRALITLDADFSDITKYPPEDFFSLIVLRLRNQNRNSVLAIFQRLTALIPEQPLLHHLWIVEEHRIRII
jgi:predicted nuclease of predicted toxin-antitoxin system